jgi:hypothetical protein
MAAGLPFLNLLLEAAWLLRAEVGFERLAPTLVLLTLAGLGLFVRLRVLRADGASGIAKAASGLLSAVSLMMLFIVL